MPHYLSGQIEEILVPLLLQMDPEDRLVAAWLFPTFWILVPLASIVLCVLSWVSCSITVRRIRLLERLIHMGGAMLFAASVIPAIFVVREILIYSLGSTSNVLGVLNNFVLFLSGAVNPTLILNWGGTWGVPIVIFVETGLFFGFFLPGDSLLVAAGVLGSIGNLDLGSLILLSILAAISGDQLSYAIGRQSSGALAARFHFVRDNLQRANEFYAKHGGKAIVFARFVPVVRTFAPAVAGAARMHYSRFVFYNMTGGTLWVLSMTLTGFFVGRIIPNVTEYLYLIIAFVVLVSQLPSIILWVRRSPKSRATD